MSSRLHRIILTLTCWLAAAATARAQDFWVYTQIYNVHAAAKGPAKAQPFGRSSTLFHAGKVYDFPSGSQVTIFEPAHDQFIICDTSRKLTTAISFEEITTRLHQIQANVAQELAKKKGIPEFDKRVRFVEFELAPKFQESYEKDKHVLRLTSPQLIYEVKCKESQSSDILDVYLTYTDWTARLNYLSRPPQAMLPGPRLALDEVLRRGNLLPTEVILRSEPFRELHLKTEHRFTWTLDATNRKTITEWENRLNGKEFEKVSFETFLQKTREVAQEKKRETR